MQKIYSSGTLQYGHIDADGIVHKDFTMESLTIADMENMLEQYPELMESTSWLARRRLTWAFSLSSLGTLTRESITPDLLGSLPMQDWNVLADTEEELTKKLKAVCEPPKNS